MPAAIPVLRCPSQRLARAHGPFRPYAPPPLLLILSTRDSSAAHRARCDRWQKLRRNPPLETADQAHPAGLRAHPQSFRHTAQAVRLRAFSGPWATSRELLQQCFVGAARGGCISVSAFESSRGPYGRTMPPQAPIVECPLARVPGRLVRRRFATRCEFQLAVPQAWPNNPTPAVSTPCDRCPWQALLPEPRRASPKSD